MEDQTKIEKIYQNIDDGRYDNKAPFVSHHTDPEAYDVWCREATRVHNLFRKETAEAVGLTGHPKLVKCWSTINEYSPEDDFLFEFSILVSLAELLLDT